MSPRLGRTPEHCRALQSTTNLPQGNELSDTYDEKSRAISQLAFGGGAGSTPAASTNSHLSKDGPAGLPPGPDRSQLGHCQYVEEGTEVSARTHSQHNRSTTRDRISGGRARASPK